MTEFKILVLECLIILMDDRCFKTQDHDYWAKLSGLRDRLKSCRKNLQRDDSNAESDT